MTAVFHSILSFRQTGKILKILYNIIIAFLFQVNSFGQIFTEDSETFRHEIAEILQDINSRKYSSIEIKIYCNFDGNFHTDSLKYFFINDTLLRCTDNKDTIYLSYQKQSIIYYYDNPLINSTEKKITETLEKIKGKIKSEKGWTIKTREKSKRIKDIKKIETLTIEKKRIAGVKPKIYVERTTNETRLITYDQFNQLVYVDYIRSDIDNHLTRSMTVKYIP